MKLKHLVLSLPTVCGRSFSGAALVLHSTNLMAGDSSMTVEVDDQQSASLSGVTAIEITEQVAADIQVTTSTGPELSAHFYGTITSNADVKKPELQIEKKNDVLFITLEQDRNWRKKLVFNARFRSDLKLDIVLPQDYAGALNIHTASGDVDCVGFSGAGIEIQTASGDVSVTDFVGDMFEISTASGDAVVKEVKPKRMMINTASGDVKFTDGDSEKIRIRTASGDMNVASVHGGQFEARSASGDLVLENITGKILSVATTSGELTTNGMSAEKVAIATTSGDIRAKGISGDVKINSTSGQVKAHVLEFKETILCTTTSGDIELAIEQQKPYRFAGSTHGDISLKTPDGKTHEAERKLYIECDDCTHTVKITSTSGDIEVK